MKKILFLLLPNFAIAQSIYIAPSASFAKTSIYNKEDVNHKVLPCTNGYAPSFGINIGKTNKSFFYEVGLNYLQINQNYKGWFIFGYDVNKVATATKKLNYLSVPILIGKQFLPSKKINPFLQVGINFNYLLNNSTKYHANYVTSVQSNASYDYEQSGINLNVNQNNGVVFTDYKLSDWYFKRFVVGTVFNVGVDYKVKDNLSIRLAVSNFVSINNPENRTKISYIANSGNSDLLGLNKKEFDPYLFSGILGPRQIAEVRGKTTLISNGISVSIKYFFNNKNND
jgi:outer membrane protein W